VIGGDHVPWHSKCKSMNVLIYTSTLKNNLNFLTNLFVRFELLNLFRFLTLNITTCFGPQEPKQVEKFKVIGLLFSSRFIDS
jgi:hypothetical protein